MNLSLCSCPHNSSLLIANGSFFNALHSSATTVWHLVSSIQNLNGRAAEKPRRARFMLFSNSPWLTEKTETRRRPRRWSAGLCPGSGWVFRASGPGGRPRL